MKNDKLYVDKVKTKGRPRLVLNAAGLKLVEKLSAVMCTDEEIEDILEVSLDTLNAEHNKTAFQEAKKKGKSSGKASLRRWQFKGAEKGNASLLIWLGKQYLGQTDKQEIEQTNNKPITINVSAASAEDLEVE